MLSFAEIGLQIQELLGAGSFAQVYQCYDPQLQEQFALKVISKQGMSSSRLKAFRKQAEILSSLNHPNVVCFHSFFQTDKILLLKMQLVRGGSLKQLMDQKKHKGEIFSEEQVAIFTKSLLEGLKYLHSLNIIHRDLKPENILFQKRGESGSVKIVDFGLSAKMDLYSPKNVKSQCGTLLFMAPQIFNKPSYTKSVDLWSISVIVYMMLKGKHPFYVPGMKVDQYKQKLKNKNFPLVENSLAQSFLTKISKHQYEERYNVGQALKHPWITRNKDDQIPLSIHQSYRSFDSTAIILKTVKTVMAVKEIVSHKTPHIDSSYLKKVHDFSHNIEQNRDRVCSPSRRKIRDKNQQLFIKIKQAISNTCTITSSYSETHSIFQEDQSPTLRRHQKYFQSLFDREKQIDSPLILSEKGKNTLIISKSIETQQYLRQGKPVNEIKKLDLFEKIQQISNDPIVENQTEPQHPQSQTFVEKQIEKQVKLLKSNVKADQKRKIFQKKPSFESDNNQYFAHRMKVNKKYSYGVGEEKKQKQQLTRSEVNSSSLTKQTKKRPYTPQTNKVTPKPMIFSVSRGNSSRRNY